MKILLAPSETKREGGEERFDAGALFFPASAARAEVMRAYEARLVRHEALEVLFGTTPRETWLVPLAERPVLPAVLRYNGVAFEALDWPTLSPEARAWLGERMMIFSNLFGPLRATDRIPEYKYKQGAKLDGVQPEKLYKQESEAVDAWVGGDAVLDLRAGFYDRFYRPRGLEVHTVLFEKGDKVVSHWAKHYRGVLARVAAEAAIEHPDELSELYVEGMRLVERRQKEGVTLWRFAV